MSSVDISPLLRGELTEMEIMEFIDNNRGRLDELKSALDAPKFQISGPDSWKVQNVMADVGEAAEENAKIMENTGLLIDECESQARPIEKIQQINDTAEMLRSLDKIEEFFKCKGKFIKYLPFKQKSEAKTYLEKMHSIAKDSEWGQNRQILDILRESQMMYESNFIA